MEMKEPEYAGLCKACAPPGNLNLTFVCLLVDNSCLHESCKACAPPGTRGKYLNPQVGKVAVNCCFWYDCLSICLFVCVCFLFLSTNL